MEDKGGTMQVIARIPDIGTFQAEPGVPDALPATAVEPVAAPPGEPKASRPRSSRSRFPMGSVMALAIVAMVAWMLASWNDGRRAERGRVERLARMRSAPITTDTLQR